MAYENKLDNSDVQLNGGAKEVVGGMFNSLQEAQAMKLYLENLKLIHELQGGKKTTATSGPSAGKDVAAVSIKVNKFDPSSGKSTSTDELVPLEDLIPKESEFERTRKVIISKLNKKSDEEIRELMARFDSEGTFELSSKITNYVLDQRKRSKAFSEWNM